MHQAQHPDKLYIERFADTVMCEKPRYTSLDIEQLRKLVDAYFIEDVPSPVERDRIVWHYIAEQLDKLGIVVEDYYRRSVYSEYVSELTEQVMKRDVLIVNNIGHIPGGAVVRLRTLPAYIIIERMQ